jgi:hypothetical protein
LSASTWPVKQLATWQACETHEAVALGRLQAMPQPPQLFGSVLMSMQLPPPALGLAPHTVSVPPQEPTQALEPQLAVPPVGAAQTRLQLPQWLASEVRFTQLPPPLAGLAPQTVSPPVHEPTQALEAQVAAPPVGGLQPLPQAPQLLGLLVRSMQVPEQLVWPLPQQVPPEQVWPPAHFMPQPPQLLTSLSSSTQVPLQLTWPVGQHLPMEQN